MLDRHASLALYRYHHHHHHYHETHLSLCSCVLYLPSGMMPPPPPPFPTTITNTHLSLWPCVSLLPCRMTLSVPPPPITPPPPPPHSLVALALCVVTALQDDAGHPIPDLVPQEGGGGVSQHRHRDHRRLALLRGHIGLLEHPGVQPRQTCQWAERRVEVFLDVIVLFLTGSISTTVLAGMSLPVRRTDICRTKDLQSRKKEGKKEGKKERRQEERKSNRKKER